MLVLLSLLFVSVVGSSVGASGIGSTGDPIDRSGTSVVLFSFSAVDSCPSPAAVDFSSSVDVFTSSFPGGCSLLSVAVPSSSLAVSVDSFSDSAPVAFLPPFFFCFWSCATYRIEPSVSDITDIN